MANMTFPCVYLALSKNTHGGIYIAHLNDDLLHSVGIRSEFPRPIMRNDIWRLTTIVIQHNQGRANVILFSFPSQRQSQFQSPSISPSVCYFFLEIARGDKENNNPILTSLRTCTLSLEWIMKTCRGLVSRIRCRYIPRESNSRQRGKYRVLSRHRVKPSKQNMRHSSICISYSIAV